MRKTLTYVAWMGIFLICSTVTASAATITIDENGNGNIDGTPLPFTANGTNPVPPGQTPVLVYTLPFTGVAGQVLLVEPETGIRGDVIQFTGSGTAIFYSKTDSDSLAERFQPPIFPFPVPNSVSITETVSGNMDGASYTPTSGQPGFDASGPTYHFISDVVVPEPTSFGLLFLGSTAILIHRFRRKIS
jgi:hypothetical protein